MMTPESTENATTPSVAIIGGGPAGLTAALELLKGGVKPLVFESDEQVGGISRTVERNGWRFDIGGHRFFTKVTRVREFWHNVLGDDDFLTRNRMSRIYYEGKFFDYPIKPFNALSKLGPIESVRCVFSYGKTKLFPPKDQSNFETWVAARFGWRLYRIFFKTYTEKVWGVPATSIQSEWAAQRIKGLSLPGAVLNAFRATFAETKHTSLIDRFEYPRLGPGMMWERATELVEQGGGEVRLQTEVVQLFRDEHGVTEVETLDANGRRRIAVDHVISSMPLGELVLAMTPPAPDLVVEAAKGLSHRDFLTVALVVPASQSFPDNWIYIHDPSVKLGRVQNFHSWSPDMVKEGYTCLGLEYFVFEGDQLWSMEDDALIAFATEEITRIGLIPPHVVEEGYVVRVPKAYPVYDAGYAERVEIIREWLSSDVPNAHPVGRNGMHRYNNQDHSMLTAMLAVENIAGANRDVWSVNVESEYHEAGNYESVPLAERSRNTTGGTGRDVPRLIETPESSAVSAPSSSSGVLVRLSSRSLRARTFFRFAFRTILNLRRRAKGFLRQFSPGELANRPAAKRLKWSLYRVAFRFSKIGWLRRAQFRLRDYASRNSQKSISLDQLLVGGWNGMSASSFAEASGFFLDPSTRLADSAQVDLLRRYDEIGDDLYETDALLATPYVQRVRAAATISGHHRGANTEEEYAVLAREFINRYRNLPIPYRPGRTTDTALPRVRKIKDSECYEIRDGHHRLAIEYVRGASDVKVIVERPTATTPAQRLLHRMSWLDGQERLYQPVPLPEVATWPLMRQCTDRLAFILDFLEVKDDDPESEHRSYLDVGACYGWFVASLRDRGFTANGIEQDPLAETLAELVFGLEKGVIQIGDAVNILRTTSHRYDVVSCFSVLHHFVLGRGSCSAEELISLLDEVTNDVLFIDTGEGHESWFKLVLPEWTPKYARQWILDHTSFTNVEAIGVDGDGVHPFEGKYGRTLFACTR